MEKRAPPRRTVAAKKKSSEKITDLPRDPSAMTTKMIMIRTGASSRRTTSGGPMRGATGATLTRIRDGEILSHHIRKSTSELNAKIVHKVILHVRADTKWSTQTTEKWHTNSKKNLETQTIARIKLKEGTRNVEKLHSKCKKFAFNAQNNRRKSSSSASVTRKIEIPHS